MSPLWIGRDFTHRHGFRASQCYRLSAVPFCSRHCLLLPIAVAVRNVVSPPSQRSVKERHRRLNLHCSYSCVLCFILRLDNASFMQPAGISISLRHVRSPLVSLMPCVCVVLFHVLTAWATVTDQPESVASRDRNPSPAWAQRGKDAGSRLCRGVGRGDISELAR